MREFLGRRRRLQTMANEHGNTAGQCVITVDEQSLILHRVAPHTVTPSERILLYEHI